MKIIEGIKHKGKPYFIKGPERNEFPEFLKQMGYKVGAEVGVYKGEYTEKFCREGLTMYGIDPWFPFKGQGRTQWLKERQAFLYGHTLRVLAKYIEKGTCTIMRKSSMEGVKAFKNNSLDFVYIDGDHRFKFIAEDIYEWIWRVRKGGVISGHDYFNTNPEAQNIVCHVGPVVDAYVKAFGVENFYVFGGRGKRKDDRWPSWFWIKNW